MRTLHDDLDAISEGSLIAIEKEWSNLCQLSHFQNNMCDYFFTVLKKQNMIANNNQQNEDNDQIEELKQDDKIQA